MTSMARRTAASALRGLFAVYTAAFDALRPMRRFVPEAVRAKLRGDRRSIDSAFYRVPAMRLEQLAFRLQGKSYVEWYEHYKNRETGKANTSPEKLAHVYATGHEDLNTLKSLGLKPGHYLHEIGCGRGRTTQHLVGYLEPGHYSANDLDAHALKQVADRLREIGLADRNAVLIHTLDNSFDWMPHKVDFLWCYGVFVHMPFADVEEILRNARPHLNPGGVFVANWTAHVSGDSFQRSHKDWYHDAGQMTAAAERAGYRVEDVSHMEPDIKQARLRPGTAHHTLKLTV